MATRIAQRKRTRQALLAAAREIMGRSEPVTLAGVANLAEISVATAYRYFSDPRVLAAEAVLDIDVRPTDDILKGASHARERAHRVADYFRELVWSHEAAFRLYLATTLEATVGQAPKRKVGVRGARRVDAFATALKPARATLSPAEITDCVHALSALTGIEQHIVMHDVCELGRVEEQRIGRIMVDAVLDSFSL